MWIKCLQFCAFRFHWFDALCKFVQFLCVRVVGVWALASLQLEGVAPIGATLHNSTVLKKSSSKNQPVASHPGLELVTPHGCCGTGHSAQGLLGGACPRLGWCVHTSAGSMGGSGRQGDSAEQHQAFMQEREPGAPCDHQETRRRATAACPKLRKAGSPSKFQEHLALPVQSLQPANGLRGAALVGAHPGCPVFGSVCGWAESRQQLDWLGNKPADKKIETFYKKT